MTDTYAQPKAKEERKDAPTILAALSLSTREERAADPKKGEELAAALKPIMDRWREQHETAYEEADRNHEFYNGNHWGYHSVALNARVLAPESPNGTPRRTVNYIRRTVEKQVTILTKDEVTLRALAEDSEIMDRAASKASDEILKWRQSRTVLCSDQENVARAKAIAGWCWVHEEWDSTAGRVVALKNKDGTPRLKPVLGDDGAPQMDPASGLQMTEPEMGPEGDFHREVLSHRQGVPDPAATHPFGGSGFFVRLRMPRFDFEERFKKDASDFPATGNDDMKKVAAIGRSSGTAKTGDSEDRDEIEVDILYTPRCKDYPRGCRVVFTEKHLIEESDNPRYPTEEEPQEGVPNQAEEPVWPVFPFLMLPRPQSALGVSCVTDAIRHNRSINWLVSKADQHADKISNIKVKVPNDLAAEWDNTQTQVIKVPRRGFDPNTLGYVASPPPMPPEYVTLWREHKDALYESMWLNQPAVGQTDEADQSGYAIRLRQQSADNDLEKVRRRDNNMWAAIGEYDLMLLRRYADTERKIMVVGENHRSTVRVFDQSSILPNTSVRCVHNSFMPRDPSMQMAWLQQFLGTGILDRPKEEKQKVFEWIGMSDAEGFIEREQGDLTRVERQLRRIMEGKDPGQVSDMDDHTVQLERIRQFGLSEEFETKVEQELAAAAEQAAITMQPPTSPTFDRVTGLYAAHKQALMAQMMAQAPPPAAPGAPMGALAPSSAP